MAREVGVGRRYGPINGFSDVQQNTCGCLWRGQQDTTRLSLTCQAAPTTASSSNSLCTRTLLWLRIFVFTNHVPLQCLQANVVQGCLASAIFLPQVGTESKKQGHVPEIMIFGGLVEGIRPAESEPPQLDLIHMLEVVLLHVDLQFFPIFCQTCWAKGTPIFPALGNSFGGCGNGKLITFHQFAATTPLFKDKWSALHGKLVGPGPNLEPMLWNPMPQMLPRASETPYIHDLYSECLTCQTYQTYPTSEDIWRYLKISDIWSFNLKQAHSQMSKEHSFLRNSAATPPAPLKCLALFQDHKPSGGTIE